MKTFQAKFNPDAKNVYGVSLVEDPAMEGDFIQFSKQEEIKFADVDKSKRRVMGLILEPEKLIYRNQGGNEFNIMFTAQDIEDVAYNFQKQANQSTSTIEHSNQNIEGVTFVETWLVENPKVDKSSNFGFSYPKGSWMGVMQLDNDEVWNDYVANGKVKGFSIDAFMQLEEVNLNQVNMSEIKEDSLVTKIVDKIALMINPKTEEVKVEEVVELAKEDETKEVEKEVEVELAEVPVEPAAEVPTETKEELDIDKFLAELIKEIDAMLNPMKEANVAMKKQIETLELSFKTQSEKIVEQDAKVLELSKAPATKTIKKLATVDLKKDYKDMTNLEKKEYNKNK